jgi:hypothetical protein
MRRQINPQGHKQGRRAQTQGLRPASFPVGSLESRAAARALLQQQQQRFQLIIYTIGEPLNLETSTCKRQIWPDGSLFDLVMLDGSYTDLTGGQLEAFVCQHPVATAQNATAADSPKNETSEPSTRTGNLPATKPIISRTEFRAGKLAREPPSPQCGLCSVIMPENRRASVGNK